MERDTSHRPRDRNAAAHTPDGMESRSENLGDTGRADFSRRMDTAREAAPSSIREAAARHRQQGRQVLEAAEPSADDSAINITDDGTAPPSDDTPSEPLSQASRAKPAPRFAEGAAASREQGSAPRSQRGTAYSRRFTEPLQDSRDAARQTDTSANTETEPPTPEQPPEAAVSSEPESAAPARDSVRNAEPASRRHDPRPGRLRFSGGEKATAPATPVKRPASPHAPVPRDADVLAGKETPQVSVAPSIADTSTTADASGTGTAPDTPVKPSRAPDSRTAPDKTKHKKPAKLRFGGEESQPASKAADKKLARSRSKADRSAEKLDAARAKLPRKKRIRSRQVFDEKSGKPKRELHFEKEVKSQRQHMNGPAVTRPVKAAGNSVVAYGHRKLYQVEHENVGTEAAHKGELAAEGGLRGLYRHSKTEPYRKVAKLTRKTTKLSIKADFRQALRDNPKLNSSMLSRMAQKRKIKKQYATGVPARPAAWGGKAAKETAQRAKKTGDIISKAAQTAVRTAARHPMAFGIIGGLLLLFFLISALFSACANLGSGVGGAIASISYLAEDADADNAELVYTEQETDLQIQIANADSARPGFDEYRYDIGAISHNPYELMAYLTAKYQEFTYAGVEAELRSLFGRQYQLTFTESTETRYADPDDVNEDGDYEPYDWRVMAVTLTARSFTDVVSDRMSAEQRQHYDMLMRSRGARQYLAKPLPFGWLPYVTSNYGWRVHPNTGVKDYHKGIDIGIPTGTEIRAGQGGVISVGYDADGYGNYVTITGADGLVSKYAHLDSVLVSDGQSVKTGDLIAKSGNSGNSTGPHLHLEVIKNGQHLNPAFFCDAGNYPARPVYAFARVNP